jgi:hypothetical protein
MTSLVAVERASGSSSTTTEQRTEGDDIVITDGAYFAAGRSERRSRREMKARRTIELMPPFETKQKRPATRVRKPLICFGILVGSASFELATPAV